MSKVLSIRVEEELYDRVEAYAKRWKMYKQDLLYSILRGSMDAWEKKALGMIIISKRPKVYNRG